MEIVSQEVLLKAKEALETSSKSWTKMDSICRGDGIDLEGRRANEGHGACHSWVSTCFRRFCPNVGVRGFSYTKYKENVDQNFIIYNCHTVRRSNASREATESVINWLAKESPFAKHFLNADDEESLKHGAILLCGPDGLTLCETMWICKFLRYSTEASENLNAWYELYKEGVDPFLATFIASNIRLIEGASFGCYRASSHPNVFSYGDYWGEKEPPDLEKILKHEFNPKSITTGAFFGTKKVNLKDCPVEKVKSFCKPVKVPDGWGGFTEGTAATRELFLSRVKEWENSLKEEYCLDGKASAKKPEKISKSTVFLDFDV